VSLEEHIAEQRDAKATRVVRWLEQAATTKPVCRRCWLGLHVDVDGRWADERDRADCAALGFRNKGLHVEHSPETWTVPRRSEERPSERERIGQLAGLTRPCSDATWERVVVLYEARSKAREGR
jgi:hypothetical protein